MQAVGEGVATFQGFSSPNYTMVPDQLFDELLASLSGNEVKVLLYITRRTFGFKRDSDNISLSQMLHGIRTADSRVLDRGVGMSKPTLLKALQSLKEQNIIVARQRRSAERGDEATSYSLNVCPNTADLPRPKNTATSGSTELTVAGGKEASHPVVKIFDQGGGQESLPPRGKNSLPHNTQVGQTVTKDIRQQHSPRSAHPVEVNERVVVALTDLGVSTKTARDLTRKHPEEQIRAQIDMLGYRKADNPAAVLVKAIQEGWAPPMGYKTPAQREAEEREAERIEAELEAWRQARMVSRETGDSGGIQTRRQAV